MRIHYLVTSLESGGAEFIIPAIADVIRGLGHDFHVFACEPRDRMAEPRLINAGIPYTLMSEGPATKRNSLRHFAKIVRSSRPQLIWTSLSHATFVGQIVGAVHRIPVVSWKHSADAKRHILRYKRLSKLWIADSTDVAEYLRGHMKINSKKIATWPLFKPTFSENPIIRWNGEGPLRIGSAGRLHPQKNYALLVRSIDRLRHENPEVFSRLEVSIAGDGPQRDELKNLVVTLGLQDKFKFLGFISDIPAYLKDLHLYIQPSVYEGMCIAAHEAMAAGLPIIATPVGELRRSIQPGINGLLIEGDIVKGIADGITYFMEHREALATYGLRARAYVERTMGAGAFTRNGMEVVERIEREVLKIPSSSRLPPMNPNYPVIPTLLKGDSPELSPAAEISEQ